MGDEREDLRPEAARREDVANEGDPTPKSEGESREIGPTYPIPEILQLAEPRDILIRLTEEDPFEVRPKIAQHLRERALVLPSMRLALMTMARMSIAATSYDGTIPIGDWVDAAIEASTESMADEQREEERRGLPVPESRDVAFYEELADMFGCPLLDARMACVVLNGMSMRHREAFRAVVIEGLAPIEAADDLDTRRVHVERRLREIGEEVHTRLERRRKARKRRRL